MSFIKTTTSKKWMAIAGLVWFGYIATHALMLSTFHMGKQAFNDFYYWFNSSIIYWPVLLVLSLTLIFHVLTGIKRQLDNNKAVGINRYHHSYPKAIPRFVAWSGASTLLLFIVFHFVQMQLLSGSDAYQQIVSIFSNPVVSIIYVLGITVLGIHLHHGLTNALQTLGISSNQHNFVAIFIVLVVALGFASIPMSVVL